MECLPSLVLCRADGEVQGETSSEIRSSITLNSLRVLPGQIASCSSCGKCLAVQQ